MIKETEDQLSKLESSLLPFKERERSDPTNLSLFSFTEARRQELKQCADSGSGFKNRFHQASTALHNYTDASNRRILRLEGILSETRTDLIHAKSANTASQAFLTIHQDLSEMGVGEKGVFDFYLRCLELNSRLTTKLFPFTDLEKIFGKTHSHKSVAAAYDDFQDQARNIPKPVWFKGDRDKWFAFVCETAYFTRLLNPNETGLHFITLNDQQSDLTYPHLLPDWLLKAKATKQLPDIAQVKQELAENSIAEARERDYMLDTQKQSLSLHYFATSKYHRANLWAQRELHRTFNTGRIESLADLAIYLNATQKVYIYSADISTISHQEFTNQHAIAPEITRDRSIRDYIAQGFITREAVALWLEKSLRSTSASLNSEGASNNLLQVLKITDQLLDTGRKGDKNQSYLTELDSKTIKFMKFDFAPLLSGLPVSDRADLIKLAEIEAQANSSAEPIYWLVADYIVANKSHIKQSGPKSSAGRVAEEIRKNAYSWLKNHWTWVYSNLESSLNSSCATGTIYFSSEEPMLTNTGGSNFQEELEKDRVELDQGSLAGWLIQYNTNRYSLDPKYFVTIIGQSVSEQEEFFKQMLIDQGITCTIKPQSVMNLLEDIVGLPAEIENTWMSESWGVVKYKKRKRDDMRFLYRRDTETKRLVIASYHKNEVV